jgi:hypothetical protein
VQAFGFGFSRSSTRFGGSLVISNLRSGARLVPAATSSAVKASVAIDGKFDKWDAILTFPSTDITSGVLDIKIYADSVNIGSGNASTAPYSILCTADLLGS